jgi:hypothetical protein
VQIGDAGITSGASPVLPVPQDPISNVQTPALVAVPVSPPPVTSVQQQLPVTPDFTTPVQRRFVVECIRLQIRQRDGNVERWCGLLRDVFGTLSITWLPDGDDLEITMSPYDPSTPRTRFPCLIPTDHSPPASLFTNEATAARLLTINRQLAMLEAEVAFHQSRLPSPPRRTTSDPYSPVSARAQTVRTPPTGHGTHSSPVVIGDSPVVLD